ncbi:MAG TPA: glycosyltransferase family 9 protein [Gemmatimonadaceae bacterium]|nr:glycosyltransferase family 9 protein [Gemmatimonadaceae bacterium]
MTRVPLNRICVVMMSAVGDAVHALSVVTALKRHNPAAKITWVLQPGPASMIRGHPDVDDIIVFERGNGWRAFRDVRRALSGRTFDVVLNLQVYFKAGIVTWFTRAPVKLGFDRERARDANWLFTTDRIPPHAQQHVQDQYFEFLDWLGVASKPVTWGLGPWADERAWQREFFAPFDRPAAAIVVATSKAEKDWMPERWARVCDALYGDFGLQPILVGGKSPRELHAESVIRGAAKVPVVSALGSGLRKLVGILDGSALALSPDTGPLHMSVALNRPVIGMYGYTNAKRAGPYDKFRDLMIDAYGDPGEDYPITMEYRYDRMERISVEDVLARVALWRERYRASHPPGGGGANK